jgi:hypothetical protein
MCLGSRRPRLDDRGVVRRCADASARTDGPRARSRSSYYVSSADEHGGAAKTYQHNSLAPESQAPPNMATDPRHCAASPRAISMPNRDLFRPLCAPAVLAPRSPPTVRRSRSPHMPRRRWLVLATVSPPQRHRRRFPASGKSRVKVETLRRHRDLAQPVRRPVRGKQVIDLRL